MSGKRTSHNRTRASQAPLPARPSPPSSSVSTRSRRGGATSVEAHGEVVMASQPSISPRYLTRNLTRNLSQPAEQEPRRSVRATKGQHTKAFEALENGPQPSKRKQSAKKGKKVAQKEEEEEDEEVIRCVCGAISQDNDDPNEPWIACEKCGAWQHNVCMGMSIFDDDLPKEYFCEQCKPEDHKELLEGMAQGEEPWVTRRQKHEDETKKKKGGKKGKAKRVSDSKDRTSPAASASKAKPSPTPEVKKEEEPVKGKRKQRDHSQGPQSKLRKVAETQVAPSTPKYTPPEDLATSADKLEPAARKKVAQGLQKSLEAALDVAIKERLFSIPKDGNKKSIVERHALEIERALHDNHSQQAASAQARTLIFNLKRNVPLAVRVFDRTLTPPTVATMSTNELATEELQRETAEMKAKADKQSTLVAEEGPRVRRTHKGEEIVENESFATTTEEVPSVLRRQSVKGASAGESSKSPNQGAAFGTSGAERPNKPLRVDTGSQKSPKHNDFDIDNVYSKVRSPSASAHQRRPSAPVPPTGPGVDPDVDRLLDDGTESPPYSPTENLDPDVVWHGDLKMGNTAEFRAIAKYAGGADLSKQSGIAWNDLIPVVLNVAGRIPEDKAVPYLCGLRYNNQIDLVITSLSVADPNDAASRTNFQTVVNYFMSKKRYGVVGDRKMGNVRDTYLVPIPEGDSPLPEPLQNIEGHLIPQNRTEPLLLLIFVYRDEKLQPFVSTEPQMPVPQGTPTPMSMQASTPVPDRRQSSVTGPTWSPATPQAPPSATFPSHQSHTPIPPPYHAQAQHQPQQQPQPQYQAQPSPQMQQPPQFQPQPPAQPPRQTPGPVAPSPAPPAQDIEATKRAQAEGEEKARQVLGPLFNSPTVTFLLPHAARMKEGEWNAVKRCLDRDPRARDDLPLLSKLLTEEGNNARQNGQTQAPQQQPNSASPGVVQTTLAAAAANLPPGAPPSAPSAAVQPKA
ncbi:PHD finger domain protein [Apiospora kogelbergensis]|uniref:PHD finger domain protein n=1 Tax=Apiospora kogelbergensis TaxID=1337665 RepID=UPI0031320631